MDLISVIIPVYNVEKYLDRCLESVTQQTYKNLEIILVDDGAPDNSGKICDEWAKRDARIKVIHKENAGLGYARNSGLDVATGKYVSFVDSDDYIALNMYETMMSKILQAQADTCLCGHYRKYRDYKETKEISFGNACFSGKDVVGKILSGMIGNFPEAGNDFELEMCVWQGLFSMEIINRNNIRFPSEREFISEDIIFDLDYYMHSEAVATVSECLYYYCMNGASLTQTFRPDRFEKEVILYKEILARSKQKGLNIKIRADRSFLGRARRYMVSVVANKKGAECDALLKKTVDDKNIEEILAYYPIEKLVKKHYIYSLLLKEKRCFLLKLYLKLIVLKDKMHR